MPATTQPLTLGEILDRAVQLYRRNFLLLVGISTPPAALVMLLSGTAVVYFTSHFNYIGIAAPAGAANPIRPQELLLLGLGGLLFLLVGLPLMLGVYAMALAALNSAVTELNRGEPATLRGSYGYAFRHFWRNVGILFLQSLLSWVVPYAVFMVLVVMGSVFSAVVSRSAAGKVMLPLLVVLLILGVIALLVAGVLLWLRFSLAYPVSAAEGLQAWPSLKRSNALSRGTRGRIFVMFLLVFVLSFVASFALMIPLDIVVGLTVRKSVAGSHAPALFLTVLQVANLGVGFLVRIFVMPIYSTALVLFYTDQRTRLEGYDIEQLMDQAGWGDLPLLPIPIEPAPGPAPTEAAGAPFPPSPEGTEA